MKKKVFQVSCIFFSLYYIIVKEDNQTTKKQE